MKFVKMTANSVLPLFSGVIYGQTMKLFSGVLCVKFATYQRSNNSYTILKIHDESGREVINYCVSNKLMNDFDFIKFYLPENLGNYGENFLVTLESKDSTAENIIGICVNEADYGELWESYNSNCVKRAIYSLSNVKGIRLDAHCIAVDGEGNVENLLGQVGKLAVNVNPQSFYERDITNDAEYALKIAMNYIDALEKSGSNINGKCILEIGPGINFGTSLVLKCMGASSVFVSDRFLAEFVTGYHDLLYSKLAQILAKRCPKADVGYLEKCSTYGYSNDIIKFSDFSLEKLGELGLCFDVILSNAVFEHLYNPWEAIKSLKILSKSGAIGIHQVDFRDHRNFDKPLEFLLLDQISFAKIFEDQNGECGNRARHQQLSRMFKKAGFSKIKYTSNMEAEKSYVNEIAMRLKESPVLGSDEFSQLDLGSISGLFVIEN